MPTYPQSPMCDPFPIFYLSLLFIFYRFCALSCHWIFLRFFPFSSSRFFFLVPSSYSFSFFLFPISTIPALTVLTNLTPSSHPLLLFFFFDYLPITPHLCSVFLYLSTLSNFFLLAAKKAKKTTNIDWCVIMMP